MRNVHLSWFSKWVPAALAVASVAVVAVACGNSDDDDTNGGTGTGGGSGSGSDGGGNGTGTGNTSCATPTAGQIPASNCDFSTTCSQANETCALTAGADCNTASACLALTSNTGTTDNFRMRGLYLAAPKALTQNSVQGLIVDTGLEFNNAACGETEGTALFNWLLTIDTSGPTLKTGGAPTPTDPFGAGFCYENDTQNGLPVAPVTAPLTKNSDGSYSTSTPIDTLNIPFGVPGSTSIVVLPLHQLTMQNISVSTDGNCIGSYKTSETTQTGCMDINGCERWNTGGALGGYITLEEADKVQVVQLEETLCALLSIYEPNTKDQSVSPATCARDSSGKIVATGDYCSTTNSAGGCADSFWLSSTFAASAVTINDGSTTDGCH